MFANRNVVYDITSFTQYSKTIILKKFMRLLGIISSKIKVNKKISFFY